LAPPAEAWRGITPGDGFPVGRIQTAQARVGMNICMDSSVEESARCVARNGAEIILMPIAGDYRATLYWEPVSHVFDLRRWEIIHQVRAMDNQVYMVVSRNYGVGTGIFAPDGVTLAMDRGADRIVYADVDLSDLKRVAATFKDKTWYTRREQTYGVLAGQAALTVREDWE
jgi:predicted amidohydrolase